jgi:hypothetical protein
VSCKITRIVKRRRRPANAPRAIGRATAPMSGVGRKDRSGAGDKA